VVMTNTSARTYLPINAYEVSWRIRKSRAPYHNYGFTPAIKPDRSGSPAGPCGPLSVTLIHLWALCYSFLYVL